MSLGIEKRREPHGHIGEILDKRNTHALRSLLNLPDLNLFHFGVIFIHTDSNQATIGANSDFLSITTDCKRAKFDTTCQIKERQSIGIQGCHPLISRVKAIIAKPYSATHLVDNLLISRVAEG